MTPPPDGGRHASSEGYDFDARPHEPVAAHPQHPSAAAATHLSPAYPARAAWGTAGRLRAWQAAALESYLQRAPRDFLAAATPGAGKTTFALRVAAELLETGVGAPRDAWSRRPST